MARFLFVYRNGSGTYYDISPEEMQQQYQKRQAWMTEGLQKGWMLDAGHGLRKEGHVVNAEKVVSDGPFIEVKEIVVVGSRLNDCHPQPVSAGTRRRNRDDASPAGPHDGCTDLVQASRVSLREAFRRPSPLA